MKKLLCIAVAVIALAVCATTVLLTKPTDGSVSAASTGVYNDTEITRTAEATDTEYKCDVCGQNFVDEDGDGICDNKGSCQQNGECGKNFVDEDGDGVCDNKGSGQCKGNSHCGQGKGNSRGGCGKGNGGQGKGLRGGCNR